MRRHVRAIHGVVALSLALALLLAQGSLPVVADDAPSGVTAQVPTGETVQASVQGDFLGSGQVGWAVISVVSATDTTPATTGHLLIFLPTPDGGWALAATRDVSSLTPMTLDTVTIAGRPAVALRATPTPMNPDLLLVRWDGTSFASIFDVSSDVDYPVPQQLEAGGAPQILRSRALWCPAYFASPPLQDVFNWDGTRYVDSTARYQDILHATDTGLEAASAQTTDPVQRQCLNDARDQISKTSGSWTRVADWPPAHELPNAISIPPQFPADNRLYALKGTRILQSVTQGRTWQQLVATIPSCRRPVAPTPQAQRLQFSPTFQADNTMLVSTDLCQPPRESLYYKLFISRDGGQTWSPVDSALSTGTLGGRSEPTSAVFSPTFSEDQRLWLFNTRSILQSADKGETWSNVTWPLAGASLLGMAASGNASGMFLLMASMHDPTREPAERYFRSTDLGQTWHETTDAFRDSTTLELPYLTFATTGSASTAYAVSRSGITWASFDAGASWHQAFAFPPGFTTPDGCQIFNLGSEVGSACGTSTQIATGFKAPIGIHGIKSTGSLPQGGTVLVQGGDALWTYKVH